MVLGHQHHIFRARRAEGFGPSLRLPLFQPIQKIIPERCIGPVAEFRGMKIG
jgi:hypothetical protein